MTDKQSSAPAEANEIFSVDRRADGVAVLRINRSGAMLCLLGVSTS